jgi:hypothetical protein
MRQNETAEETRKFDHVTHQETAPHPSNPPAVILYVLFGAAIGACMVVIFLAPFILKVREVMP